MKVLVHLHTTLQRQTTAGLVRKLDVELEPGARVSGLLAALAIDMPVDALLVAVNGRVALDDQVLKDGDQVNLMPAISGG